MSVRFQCACGKKLKASDDKIGKRVLCSGCGNPVTVPSRDLGREEVGLVGTEWPESGVSQHSAQTARELLKLTASAGKAERQARDPGAKAQKKPPPADGVAFSELLRFYGFKVGLPLAGVAAACLLLFWISSSIFDNPNYPELAPVSGKVMLDGKPIHKAKVLFRYDPSQPDYNKIGQSDGTTDEEGYYSLEYVPGIPGAAIGRHIVEISATDESGRELLRRYNDFDPRNSDRQMVREVKAGKNTDFDFDLKSGN